MGFGQPMQMQPAMIIKPGSVYWQGDIESYRQVGHCLTALLFGVVGGAWSVYARERNGRGAGSTNGSGAGAGVP
jgi:hypothetical protein